MTLVHGEPRVPATLPRTLSSLTDLFPTVGGKRRPYKATTTNCPSCGLPLMRPEIAAHTTQTAPFLCTSERFGYWNVELHPAARKLYRSHRRDWGPTAQWLREAVKRERGQ